MDAAETGEVENKTKNVLAMTHFFKSRVDILVNLQLVAIQTLNPVLKKWSCFFFGECVVFRDVMFSNWDIDIGGVLSSFFFSW